MPCSVKPALARALHSWRSGKSLLNEERTGTSLLGQLSFLAVMRHPGAALCIAGITWGEESNLGGEETRTKTRVSMALGITKVEGLCIMLTVLNSEWWRIWIIAIFPCFSVFYRYP